MEYRGRTSVGSVEFSDGRSSPGVILIAIAMREILNLRSGGCSLRPVHWPGLHFGIRKSCAYLVVIGCGWHTASAAGCYVIEEHRREHWGMEHRDDLRNWQLLLEILRYSAMTLFEFSTSLRETALPPIYLFRPIFARMRDVTSVIQHPRHRGASRERRGMDCYDGFVEGDIRWCRLRYFRHDTFQISVRVSFIGRISRTNECRECRV